jgi:hypothetical protein
VNKREQSGPRELLEVRVRLAEPEHVMAPRRAMRGKASLADHVGPPAHGVAAHQRRCPRRSTSTYKDGTVTSDPGHPKK